MMMRHSPVHHQSPAHRQSPVHHGHVADYSLDNPLVTALLEKTVSAEKELRSARRKARKAEQRVARMMKTATSVASAVPPGHVKYEGKEKRKNRSTVVGSWSGKRDNDTKKKKNKKKSKKKKKQKKRSRKKAQEQREGTLRWRRNRRGSYGEWRRSGSESVSASTSEGGNESDSDSDSAFHDKDDDREDYDGDDDVTLLSLEDKQDRLLRLERDARRLDGELTRLKRRKQQEEFRGSSRTSAGRRQARGGSGSRNRVWKGTWGERESPSSRRRRSRQFEAQFDQRRHGAHIRRQRRHQEHRYEHQRQGRKSRQNRPPEYSQRRPVAGHNTAFRMRGPDNQQDLPNFHTRLHPHLQQQLEEEEEIAHSREVHAVGDYPLRLRQQLASPTSESELLKNLLSKEAEAAKLRLDISALEAKASNASEQSEARRQELEQVRTKLQQKEQNFEQHKQDLAAQAKAYKKMVGDMHRVLESAERKRSGEIKQLRQKYAALKSSYQKINNQIAIEKEVHSRRLARQQAIQPSTIFDDDNMSWGTAIPRKSSRHDLGGAKNETFSSTIEVKGQSLDEAHSDTDVQRSSTAFRRNKSVSHDSADIEIQRSKSRPVAVALFDHDANYGDEVDLRKGDRVAIVNAQDVDGWVEVENLTNRTMGQNTGMAPLNLLMSTRPLLPNEAFVVASGSYTAQTPHEISFAKGQNIIMVHRSGVSPRGRFGTAGTYDHHTGYGELPDGTKGLFPVAKLEDPSDSRIPAQRTFEPHHPSALLSTGVPMDKAPKKPEPQVEGLQYLKVLVDGRTASQLSDDEVREALNAAGIETNSMTPRSTMDIQLQTLLNMLPDRQRPSTEQEANKAAGSFFSPLPSSARNLRDAVETAGPSTGMGDTPSQKAETDAAYAVEEFDEGLYFQLNVPAGKLGIGVEERDVDGEPGVVVAEFSPDSVGQRAGVRKGDLVTMVKVDSPYQVFNTNTNDAFVHVFHEFPESKKTLMIFREHQDGVETLPEPVDWLETPSMLREYSTP